MARIFDATTPNFTGRHGQPVASMRSPSPSAATFAGRARLLLMTAVYCAGLFYVYIAYLNPVWDYFGFPIFDPAKSTEAVGLALAACLVTSVALPPVVTLYSHFVLWFLFFFLYVPVMIIVAMQGLEGDGGTQLVLSLALSFALAQIIPAIASSAVSPARFSEGTSPQSRSKQVPMKGSAHLFEVAFWGFYIAILVFLLVVFGNVIRIANFYEVYEQRALAGEIGAEAGAGYVLNWFARVLNPILIAVGLLQRRPIYVAVGIGGLLLVYSIIGAKYIPALILLMFALYILCFMGREIRAERIGIILVGALLFCILLILVFGRVIDGPLNIVLSQALMRFFGNPGAQVGIYSQFAQLYGVTYYSHISIIASFVEYPFAKPLGFMIGYFWVNSEGYNANASFWATDGLAAMGYSGVILIGAVLGSMLAFVDRLIAPEKLRLICLSSVSTIWMLVDSSFFATILTGGAFLQVILAVYRPMPSNGFDRSLPLNHRAS